MQLSRPSGAWLREPRLHGRIQAFGVVQGATGVHYSVDRNCVLLFFKGALPGSSIILDLSHPATR
ncbi:hypothetical protein [Erwinia sp. ErVv1]|uniref:hypothetical protein n=1 Tax=Erwinia sp. ErVv1 TaxID=1603299 RepID=UPI000A6B2E5F|nr:hypothetical protein [Erwinia sp. ErVv1]